MNWISLLNIFDENKHGEELSKATNRLSNESAAIERRRKCVATRLSPKFSSKMDGGAKGELIRKAWSKCCEAKSSHFVFKSPLSVLRVVIGPVSVAQEDVASLKKP